MLIPMAGLIMDYKDLWMLTAHLDKLNDEKDIDNINKVA